MFRKRSLFLIPSIFLSFANLSFAGEIEDTWLFCGDLLQENPTRTEIFSIAGSTWMIHIQSDDSVEIWSLRSRVMNLQDTLDINLDYVTIFNAYGKVSSSPNILSIDMDGGYRPTSYTINRTTLFSQSDLGGLSQCSFSGEGELALVRAKWTEMIRIVQSYNQTLVNEANRALSDRKL